MNQQNDLQHREWQKAALNVDRAMDRTAHASVIIDHYLVVVNGRLPGGSLRRLANLIVFDMQKETCTQVEIFGMELDLLFHHSACYWKDNQIIVYGGYAGPGKFFSDVAIITLSFTESGSITAEWKTIETNSRIGRVGHTAHIYNNQMIVLRGDLKGKASHGHNTDISILNLDDFTWTQPKTEGSPSEGLDFHSSVLIGNEVYVIGKKDSGVQSLTFLSLNLETYIWKEVEKVPWGLYEFAAIQEHKGKIYLLTIFKEQRKMNFMSFDISQGKWSDLQSKVENSYTGRHFTLNVYDNQLVIYGGDLSNGLFLFRLEDSEISKDLLLENSEISKGPIENENIMKKFLREAPYADVTFEVESKSIPAHKWWLSKKSKYFANMFSSGMMEAKSSKIVISDMTAATFRAFLEYLYSDDVKLDVTLAKDLLTQADKYSVPALKELCEQFLLNNISPENYVLLASLSELLETNKLRDAVRDYITKNIKTLKPRKDFEEISMDMLRDVIVKLTVR